jgi:hypothetical protein
VGIATGYGLHDLGVGVRVPVGSGIVSSLYRPDRLWGHPATCSVDTGGSFREVKRQGGEADHSPQLVPRSRKCGSIHPLSPIRPRGVVLN